MNLKKLLENHKVWLVVGGLATAAGLVIAWKSYQAQKQGNQAAQDATSQQSEEDSLLSSLLQTPLSSVGSANNNGSTSTADTGNSDFQELLAALLSSGNSSGSTDTGSGGSTSSGSTDTGNGGSTSGGSTGTVSNPIGKPVGTPQPVAGNPPVIGVPLKPTVPQEKLFTSNSQ